METRNPNFSSHLRSYCQDMSRLDNESGVWCVPHAIRNVDVPLNDAAPATAPLRVYLIRHGETAWTLTGQHTGRTDLPLTPNGKVMARALAKGLAGITFSTVLASPLARARETCELAGLGAQAIVDQDLAEWDYGDFEGMSTTEIRRLHPCWDVWDDGCTHGEMASDVVARAERVITRLCGLSGDVALFSHGQFGRVLASLWIGSPAWRGKHLDLDPASISVLGFSSTHVNRRVIALWNSSSGH